MLLLDLNQTMISNLMMQLGNHTNAELDEDLLRHMVLNSIKRYITKFRAEYGELVICADSVSWRKEVFPYYKANRKINRDESELDWNLIFGCLNKFCDELKENFPYRVIKVDRAEADDVVGTLVEKFGNTNEKLLIISADKDFKQLQAYLNVQQYDAIRDRWLICNDAELFLKEQIIRGDTGDGVPNFLSQDDCLVLKIRQKSVMQKKLDEWLKQEPEDFCDEQMLSRYRRNEKLIDLRFTPADIKDNIILEYEAQAGKNRSKLMKYFMNHNLKTLMEDLGDF